MQEYEFETERLKARLLGIKDKDFFISLYTDPLIMKYIAKPLCKEKALLMFDNALKNSSLSFVDAKQHIWLIILKSTNQLIGIQSFTYNTDENDSAEAGMIFCRNVQKKGFAVEAFKGFIDFGLSVMALNKVFTYCSRGNEAAIKVIVKTGFKKLDSQSELLGFSIS
ncbi:GNAT family N-acetyltransferase [Shewanella sp. TC10]|uniref:GNAT family N-acetyltransferase n=1 Tax=Shewanella sp. TC10 TaxID=1419739 RepID=UPI00129D8B17|nr:GNAT family N-acetyltransferase [Shewanella sp. TC10]